MASSNEEKELRQRKKSILKFFTEVMVFFIFIQFILHYVGIKIVSGISMEPNYYQGNIVFYNGLKEPDYGDVVIIKIKASKERKSYNIIKRVIAKEGDRIYAKNNKVYVNGKAIEEKYLGEETLTKDFPERIVDDDCYFVMGDNRMHSSDSREIGPINKKQIIGKL